MAGLLFALGLLAAPVQPDREETLRRLHELQGEIERLLAELPPAERDEVRLRLAAGEPLAGGSDDDSQPGPDAEVPAREVETGGTATPPAAPGHSDERPLRCNTLLAFDASGDGLVSAADRHWRSLFLWVDRNGNRRREENEVRHVFEHGVRSLPVTLDRYTHRNGAVGDVWLELGEIRIALLRGRGPAYGVLLLDGEVLTRGSDFAILSPQGEEISGLEPFAPGWQLRTADGATTPLDCP